LDVPEHERSSGTPSVEEVGLRVEVDPVTERGDRAAEGLTVRLGGELDMEGAPALEQKLIGLIGAAATITVDLTGLEFIDSSGLQCLLRVSEHARGKGQTLRFRPGSGQVEGVMRLTKVGEMLPFVD
jgi:anti-anti-sigma factor